ncbi:luciferin sulfotransferase [Condylostylus longicornis]|uniref:luciferin sulfotransferase n=1 Tax=Condylostylus longicornis TaxID=2530218 RepID=UPI00244DF0B7|nr:luciferin sulfotransferase [Condylostylus longicornis]
MKFSYKNVDQHVAEKLYNFFPVQNCFIEVNPGKVILPRKYIDIGQSILDLPIHSDDVWLISYPRTGSTWAQEMIWLLGNGLDFEGAKQIQQIRSPLLELTAIFGEDHHEWVASSIGNTVECVKNMPRPRFARSHLPSQLLPVQLKEIKPKIVYTARNPKDLCVSFYHYCKLVHGLYAPFEDFCELFIDETSPIGSYWSHILPFWEKRYDKNILFLKYEDMKRNLPEIIHECAKFLEIDYKLSNSDMERMCEHLKFDKMQSNPAVNLDPIINNPIIQNGIECSDNGNCEQIKFIRKGQIGDWKNYIKGDLLERFDEWIEKNTKGTDLIFDYE